MDILTLISNLMYLIASLYLLHSGKKLEGIVVMIIFIVSHIYHTNIYSTTWKTIDITVSVLGFIYLFVMHHEKILEYTNLLYFIILMAVYWIGFGCYYIDIYGRTLYCFFHSIWHILSALYGLYIVID